VVIRYYNAALIYRRAIQLRVTMRTILALATLALLGACAASVRVPGVDISAAPVGIRVGGGGGGGFCPPGQAKKGNC
jgi:hypothetical protein